ncbi:MAG: phenylalanine--tRNA ligase alpha subunit [Planctomycetota bacterium]|nr:MAG: phenylalanine--tRNA ligase alpha subunit [Planctomycetota bacterium]
MSTTTPRDELERLSREALAAIEAAESGEQLEQIEKTALARKGPLMSLMRGIKDLPAEERAPFGQAVNAARQSLEEAVVSRRDAFTAQRLAAEASDTRFDPSEPARPLSHGHLHPITRIRREAEEVFMGLGFSVVDGPEVETEAYNFDYLNIPSHHPARDMQDTMWLDSGHVMRTHTSPVQLRAMQRAEGKPPVRVIAPGRVFRNEQPDATHEHTFHQVEGLMVDEGVSVADMKAVLRLALSRLFGGSVEVRLRPHYFPFVEPGFELDMRPAGSPDDAPWLEILGCGMVHPEVLRAGGMDPEQVSGFAFGMGLDRLAMMRFGIEDVRWMMSGDLRFLQQF